MAARFARRLRRDATEAETWLWARLRSRQLEGHRFRRQAPIGPYIVDFCCFSQNLIVELDGGQHAESRADVLRTRWLQARGFRELRFWNHDVLANTEGVLETIREALREN